MVSAQLRCREGIKPWPQRNRQSKRRRRQEEGNGGKEGGKKREKCQSEFLNILLSMEICTVQLQMFQCKCKWQHRCAQTHTHTYTLSQSKGERQKWSYKAAAVIRILAPENNHASKHSFVTFLHFFNFDFTIAIFLYLSPHEIVVIIKRKEKGLTMQCIRKRWEAQSMLQRLSSAWHSDILWNWRKLSNPFFLTKRTSFL